MATDHNSEHRDHRKSVLMIILALALVALGAILLITWINHLDNQSNSNRKNIQRITLDRHSKLVILAQTDLNVCRTGNSRAAREDVKWALLAGLVKANLPDHPGEPGYDYYKDHPDQLAVARKQNARIVKIMLRPFPRDKCNALKSVTSLDPHDRKAVLHHR